MELPKIFLSYSWANKEYANQIDLDFQALGITFTRDIRDVPLYGNIKEFMKKVRKTDYVLMLISGSYLKSKNCMYEVLEFIKDENYKDKILPIILEDANVYDLKSKMKYIKYWEEQLTELKSEVANLDILNSVSIIEEIKVVEQIARTISQFMSELTYMKSVSLNVLRQSKYQQILDFINFDNSKLLIELLNIYFIEDKEEKQVLLESFISKYNNYPEGYFYRAIFAYEEEKYKVAKTNLLKVIDINPKHVVAYYNLGNAYYQLNEYENAKYAYEIIIILKHILILQIRFLN